MAIVASWGGGINSTAMLIGMVVNRPKTFVNELRIRPTAILFADTGGEKPETYDFKNKFNDWLCNEGFPEIETVTNASRSIHASLEAECLTKKTLPALVFGWKSCSDKWKRRPQDRWLKEHGLFNSDTVKVIGFDAGEKHRAERAKDDIFKLWFPLVEWNWFREDCEKVIKRVGLSVPVKSACFFCPASTKPEVLNLRANSPELYERAVAMEKNASGLTTVKGLGRHWSWEDLTGQCLPVVEQTCMCFDEGE